MRFLELSLDKNLRETVARGTPMFPCSYYDATTDMYLGHEVPWHWHEELEISVVLDGAAMVSCGESSFATRPGQGFFINSNVLHTIRPLDGGNCRLKTLVFHHSLLSGAPESVFEQKYIRPILSSSKVEAFCFSPEIDWQQEAIAHTLRAFDAVEESTFGYELRVRENLTHVWYLLALHTTSILAKRKSITSVLQPLKQRTFVKQRRFPPAKNQLPSCRVRRQAAHASRLVFQGGKGGWLLGSLGVNVGLSGLPGM